jgi:hypothetical protein
VSFLRRLLGGGSEADAGGSVAGSAGDGGAAGATTRAGEDEVERDRRLLREEADRLSDDLIQRQLRYADRKWTPPAQGGERRADDRGADEG